MRLYKNISGALMSFSFLIKSFIDVISCILLLSWFYVSYQFYYSYEAFYVPNALVIDHYFNLTFFGWLFLIAHYADMKPWGKLTVLAFTEMLLLNTYQLHIGFEHRHYFISWLGLIFSIILIGYTYYVINYFNQLFNRKN